MHESVLGRPVYNGKFGKQLKVSTLCCWLSNLQCHYMMGHQVATKQHEQKGVFSNVRK